jgi:hypothetical protein
MGGYGLRKVYKNEFDRDPERYVLRIGYTGGGNDGQEHHQRDDAFA